MTTILKAQQEMERRQTSGEALMAAPTTQGPRVQWRSVVLVMATSVAFAAGFARWLRSPTGPADAPNPLPIAGGAKPEHPPETLPRSAPAAIAARDREVPFGRMQAKRPAVPVVAARVEAEPPRAEKNARGRSEPPPPRAQRPVPREAAARPRVEEPAASAPANDAPDAEPETRPAAASGAPRIQVSAIAYSADVGQRSVTLRIDGGPPMMLHEGESAGGIEVQLIMPNAIYVHHGGNILSVAPSR